MRHLLFCNYPLRLGNEGPGTGGLCPTCKTGRFAFALTCTFRTPLSGALVKMEPGPGGRVKGTGESLPWQAESSVSGVLVSGWGNLGLEERTLSSGAGNS